MSDTAIQTIVEAVTTGAAAAAKGIAGSLVKSSFEKLTKGITNALGLDRKEELLKRIESEPERAKPELARLLMTIDANALSQLAEAARSFMELAQPQLTQNAYHLSVAGDVQTLVQGSGAQITVNAAAKSRRRTKR